MVFSNAMVDVDVDGALLGVLGLSIAIAMAVSDSPSDTSLGERAISLRLSKSLASSLMVLLELEELEPELGRGLEGVTT